MSDNTQEIKRSVKDILVQARDDIAITYWVQNKEFDYGNWDYIDSLPKYREVKVEHYNDGDVRTKETTEGKKAAITGVCSIGAVALATMTLYDVPLSQYSDIAERDGYTKAAGHILAAAIVETDGPGWMGYDNEAELIATWNDYNGRTRDQVLAVFDAAIKHPLIEATELWGIRSGAWGEPIHGILFGSLQEAREFCDLVSDETRRFLQVQEYREHENPVVSTLVSDHDRTDWEVHQYVSLVPVPA